MFAYLVKRLLMMLPTLFIITFASYGMLRVAPGDPVKANMAMSEGGGKSGGGDVQREGESAAAKAFRKYYGLDQSILTGYWWWLTGNPNLPGSRGILRGDFGISLTVSLGSPVSAMLAQRLPPTLKLNFWSLIFIYGIAIPVGIYAAIHRQRLLDRGSAFVFFLLYSLPSFWLGLLLIIFVSRYLPWWPTRGLDAALPLTASYWQVLGETVWRYVLPVLCLSCGGLAFLSRYSRSAMLEVIRQDYIRTARAKGLPERVVILKHALRNGMIPLITMFAGLLPGLISGSVFVEIIFGIPGMGMLAMEAIGSRDYPLLMTLFALTSALTMVGILLSDLAYCLVDPRISLGGKGN
ncbi:MAG: ABC transporter permease [Planctomycetota bacterium]|jgi:peptide/nickel transport system permease protein|nr:ABC transporter permease [Planctomycetota bacterium]